MHSRTHLLPHGMPPRFLGVARRFVVFAVVGLCIALRGGEVRADDGFVVVVNSKNPAGTLARDFVFDAFLKRTTRWDDGEGIRPVDLGANSGTRRDFSDRILHRSIAAVRSYWQQRIFSGRDIPPPELGSDEAVLTYVQRNRGAIGYISATTPPRDVKVVAVR